MSNNIEYEASLKIIHDFLVEQRLVAKQTGMYPLVDRALQDVEGEIGKIDPLVLQVILSAGKRYAWQTSLKREG